MRGWWWVRKEKVEGAEKKEVTKKLLHFSPLQGQTSLCGVQPTADDQGFDKESQPAAVRPTCKGGTLCEACVTKVCG